MCSTVPQFGWSLGNLEAKPPKGGCDRAGVPRKTGEIPHYPPFKKSTPPNRVCRSPRFVVCQRALKVGCRPLVYVPCPPGGILWTSFNPLLLQGMRFLAIPRRRVLSPSWKRELRRFEYFDEFFSPITFLFPICFLLYFSGSAGEAGIFVPFSGWFNAYSHSGRNSGLGPAGAFPPPIRFASIFFPPPVASTCLSLPGDFKRFLSQTSLLIYG